MNIKTADELTEGDRFQYLSTPGTTYRVSGIGVATEPGRTPVHVGGGHILAIQNDTALILV